MNCQYTLAHCSIWLRKTWCSQSAFLLILVVLVAPRKANSCYFSCRFTFRVDLIFARHCGSRYLNIKVNSWGYLRWALIFRFLKCFFFMKSCRDARQVGNLVLVSEYTSNKPTIANPAGRELHFITDSHKRGTTLTLCTCRNLSVGAIF